MSRYTYKESTSPDFCIHTTPNLEPDAEAWLRSGSFEAADEVLDWLGFPEARTFEIIEGGR